MSHNDVWITWGKYTNEAEIRASRNYFAVRLGFPGPKLRSVHPVPQARLTLLHHEERRMLRQHLDHVLRQDLQDEYKEAVNETLLNLNTLPNERRVRISSEIQSDARPPTSDFDPNDRAYANDFTAGSPQQHSHSPPSLHVREHTAPTSGNRARSNPYAEYMSDNRQGDSPLTRSDNMHSARSHDEDMYERGDSDHADHTIRIRRSRSILREAKSDREQFLWNQQLGSPSSDRHDKRSTGSKDHSARSPAVGSHIRRQGDTYEDDLARDFRDTLNLNQQDRYSERPYVPQTDRGRARDHADDRRRDDGYDDDRYDRIRQDRTPRSSSHMGSSYETSPGPTSADVYDKYDRMYESGYSPRYEHRGRSRDFREDEYDYRRNSRRKSRHGSEHHSRSRDGRDLDEGHNDEGASHRRLERHLDSESHERRRHSRNSRSETPSRRSLRRETVFGPFSAELIFSVIQKGERVDFFDALYELHPEHAPRGHCVTLVRKSWLSWKYMPLIVQLLRKGSVRDIEDVFAKSNMDDLFRALKGEISGRRRLW